MNNKLVISTKYFGIIELISTLILPNQLLAKVAKNIFIQSDLDLVLIEYYEDIVEF